MIAVFRSLCLTALVLAAWAEDRFPSPDFTNGYQIPTPTTPPPAALWWAALDVTLLAAALGLAGWAAMKRRSRTAMAWIALGSLVWFGFIRHGCTCSIGAIQDVAHAAANGGGLSWTAAAFFLLPLITALIAGRLFCAGVCPLGAIQDLVLVKPMRLPVALERCFGLLPYAYLALAVVWAATGAAYVICAYDPFVGFFRLDGPASMLILGGGLLLTATVIGRPYCRFLCPYGVLLRWLSPLAHWRIRIHPSACVNCRLCEESCPYGAIRMPLPATAPRPSRALLAALLLATPLLVALGGWLGWRAGHTLAQRHNTVVLAERLRAEEAGTATGPNDASDAFHRLGKPTDELFAAAVTISHRTSLWAAGAGGFLGLVVAISLLNLSRRRRQDTYEADAAACVSCARCLPDCPGDLAKPALPAGATP